MRIKHVIRVMALLAVLAVGCNRSTPPPFKPIADTKLLMQSVIDPNADIVWEAVQTIISAEGTEEIRPRSDEAWTEVRNAAITLAESGNLLMMVPRAKDGGEWMTRAKEFIDASEAAIRAAEAKNADRLFTIGGDIYETCSRCHQKYLEAIANANK